MKKSDVNKLHKWYLENKRPLPWRKNRKAYNIWISETMLQQTTTAAVTPFFQRFIKNFPTLKSLAKAPESKVLENWAGLGYYSRARNLHKAAKLLVKNGGFPKTAAELIEYPGLGPYTSRAVSSIAFGEKVGVLDGNVIRVLCRKMNWKLEWWKTAPRRQLQELADSLVQDYPSHEINQALMELGSMICSPKSPHCGLCPWAKSCEARKANTTLELPLKRQKAKFEDWELKTYIARNNGKIAIVKNQNSPFLRQQWVLPFEAKKLTEKPQKFDFKHSITKYNIYVQIDKNIKKTLKNLHKQTEYKWVRPDEIHKYSPTSLVSKTLIQFEADL